MSIDDLEQRLRSSLDHQAAHQSDHQSGHGADLADVFGRARRIRRRRTALVVSAAAVAVVAVAVPAGALLASRDTSAPPPPVSTVSPTPTPAQTPTASGPGLGGLPVGPQTRLTYLDPTGVMHNGQALPGGARSADGTPVSAFTAYHGGWLIAYAPDRLVQLDSTGHVVRQGKGGTIVTSSDGTQAAWQIGQTVSAGIASGMGEGETSWDLKPTEGLVGYLGAGPVVSGAQGYTILAGPDSLSDIDSAITPTTVSQPADAVGGVVGTVANDDQQGALADAETGELYWKGAWTPLSFSPDGKYVAAIPVVDNGDVSAIAILDAQTGTLIARTPDLSGQLYLGKNLAWDGDRLVFDVAPADLQDEQALVALHTDGRLEQVSPTLSTPNMDNFAGAGGFVFMTR